MSRCGWLSSILFYNWRNINWRDGDLWFCYCLLLNLCLLSLYLDLSLYLLLLNLFPKSLFLIDFFLGHLVYHHLFLIRSRWLSILDLRPRNTSWITLKVRFAPHLDHEFVVLELHWTPLYCPSIEGSTGGGGIYYHLQGGGVLIVC